MTLKMTKTRDLLLLWLLCSPSHAPSLTLSPRLTSSPHVYVIQRDSIATQRARALIDPVAARHSSSFFVADRCRSSSLMAAGGCDRAIAGQLAACGCACGDVCMSRGFPRQRRQLLVLVLTLTGGRVLLVRPSARARFARRASCLLPVASRVASGVWVSVAITKLNL